MIVPILNGAKYIPDIVTYLIEQSFKDLEIIFVVSDQCIDNSLEVLEQNVKHLKTYRIVRYCGESELGGSKNLGMETSSGDYYWFLDVDDIPSFSYLSEMVSIMKKYEADLVGCNFIYSNERTKMKEDLQKYPVTIMNRSEALIARATEKFPVTSWSMLYDAKIIEEYGIKFSEGIAEDIGFTYKVISHSNVICYYEKPLYKYILTSGSVCNNPDLSNKRGMAEIMQYDMLEEYFQDDDLFPFLKRKFSLIRMRSAGHMRYSGFMTYIKSGECISNYRENLLKPVSLEGLICLMFSSCYYLAIRLFFYAYYYHSGRQYTNNKPERHIQHVLWLK